MQKDLVEAPDGGYYEVHIRHMGTCTIPGNGALSRKAHMPGALSTY